MRAPQAGRGISVQKRLARDAREREAEAAVETGSQTNPIDLTASDPIPSKKLKVKVVDGELREVGPGGEVLPRRNGEKLKVYVKDGVMLIDDRGNGERGERVGGGGNGGKGAVLGGGVGSRGAVRGRGAAGGRGAVRSRGAAGGRTAAINRNGGPVVLSLGDEGEIVMDQMEN
jgi:hypothetical protein